MNTEHSLPPNNPDFSNRSTSTSSPYLSFAFAIQNAALDPAAPAPTMATLFAASGAGRLRTACGSRECANGSHEGTWKATVTATRAESVRKCIVDVGGIVEDDGGRERRVL